MTFQPVLVNSDNNITNNTVNYHNQIFDVGDVKGYHIELGTRSSRQQPATHYYYHKCTFNIKNVANLYMELGEKTNPPHPFINHYHYYDCKFNNYE